MSKFSRALNEYEYIRNTLPFAMRRIDRRSSHNFMGEKRKRETDTQRENACEKFRSLIEFCVNFFLLLWSFSFSNEVFPIANLMSQLEIATMKNHI